MAGGWPPRLTPASGCGEIVQDAHNGFLYQDSDCDDFGRKIAAALSDTDEDLPRLAMQTANALFDERAVMRQIHCALEGLLCNFNSEWSERSLDTIQVSKRKRGDGRAQAQERMGTSFSPHTGPRTRE